VRVRAELLREVVERRLYASDHVVHVPRMGRMVRCCLSGINCRFKLETCDETESVFGDFLHQLSRRPAEPRRNDGREAVQFA
jgi:hypothetical protein